MTRQTKANLLSTLLHGVIVVALFSLPHPEAAKKPALELNFCFLEPQQALASIPEPPGEPLAGAAAVKAEEPVAAAPVPPPLPEEKHEPQPVAPPVPEKPRKVAVQPKPRPVKPAPAPQPVRQEVATQPQESVPTGEEAATPTTAAGITASQVAANPVATKTDRASGPAVGQAGAERGASPWRDVTFGQGSGPAFAKRILPEYPWQARRLGRQGKVVLRLHINSQGVLENVEIVESGGSLFDEASLAAVRTSSFRPAMVQGTPVASTALLPVKFNLKNDDAGGG